MMRARSQRQSFLGPHSDAVLARSRALVIGTSGGGSHIGQQLAHIGFGHVDLVDPSCIGVRHQHRLVGTSAVAVRRGWKKVHAVQRLMRRVHPEGSVDAHPVRWQEVPDVVRSSQIVFACVDGYLVRDEIERFTRRFELPLIDVGMDVLRGDHDDHRIVGQVILSMPGGPCMRCMGYLRDDLLKAEALKYGAAGENPQVIWPNGVLASTAVGMAVQLLLPWRQNTVPAPYLVYDGDALTMYPHPRLRYASGTCRHFDGVRGVGDPLFELRR